MTNSVDMASLLGSTELALGEWHMRQPASRPEDDRKRRLRPIVRAIVWLTPWYEPTRAVGAHMVMPAAGSVKENRAPPCEDSLSAAMRPPWASMTERQMRRPMPIPPSLVVKKLSKRRVTCCGSIPGPLSSTEQRKVAGSCDDGADADVAVRASGLRHRLHGVDSQINDHLLQLRAVGKYLLRAQCREVRDGNPRDSTS